MRLNKFIADCGVCSRRKADELIAGKKIKVNDKIISQLGYVVKDSDIIKYQNKQISPQNDFVYYKLHKPKGYITSSSDEKDRKTVLSLMHGIKKRIYPVGRLDYDTEGLLLLTNDGELTNKLTHPKHLIEKVYIVQLDKKLTPDDITTIEKGVNIGDYTTSQSNIVILENSLDRVRVQITITEGKNHQVKKMFEAVGKTVTFLKRTKIGEISLGGMARGEYKALNQNELNYIKSIKSAEV